MPLTYPPTSTPLGSASFPHRLMHGAPTEIQYVHPDGSDTRDGFDEGTAKATMQAAYAALPSSGGILNVLPARHDVGAGLVLTKGKRVHIQSLGHWQRAASPFSGSTWNTGGGAVLFSSGAPTNLLSWTAANDNEEGFSAENVIFECNSSITRAIYAEGVNHGYISNCGFMMKNASGIAIVLDHNVGVTGDDSSWWRVMNNLCGGGGAFFDTLASANNNNNLVSGNLIFFDGTAIQMRFAHRSSIMFNNIEGNAVGPFIKLTNCFACMTMGNSGECSTAGNIFIQLDASHGNTLLGDIGTSTPTATDKLYDFINSSRDNLAVTGVYSSQSSLYGAGPSTFWGDTDPNLRNYRIVSGAAGAIREGTWLPKFKQGSGTPESVVFGHPGDIFQRDDGLAGQALYVKDSGSETTTGWFPLNQVPGAFQFRADISPAQLTANTDNYAPTGIDTCSVLRVSTDASRNLSGITNGADGRILFLMNVGANPLVLLHDQLSTAANRFLCPSGVSFTLPANGGIQLVYDAGSSRWRVVHN